jgi:DNA-binding HxlR family transcriptional regulator
MARQYTCGLDAAMDVIGGKWKALILWALHAEELRFGELRRAVAGISEKMLIQQLRELESRGIVHREVFREVPPKVVYSLTPARALAQRGVAATGCVGTGQRRTPGVDRRPGARGLGDFRAKFAEFARDGNRAGPCRALSDTVGELLLTFRSTRGNHFSSENPDCLRHLR